MDAAAATETDASPAGELEFAASEHDALLARCLEAKARAADIMARARTALADAEDRLRRAEAAQLAAARSLERMKAARLGR